jgi:outer membrane protein assembly factor BamB
MAERLGHDGEQVLATQRRARVPRIGLTCRLCVFFSSKNSEHSINRKRPPPLWRPFKERSMPTTKLKHHVPTILSLVLGCGLLAAAAVTRAKGSWPMWGGTLERNMANPSETGIATEWNVKTKKNIKWVATLGSQSYAGPIVAGGKIFVGTNNESTRNPKVKGDKGNMVCFDQETGKFLWQAVHDKLPTGRVNDWPEQGVCSTPTVEGDRMYYVSNRCELVCLDAEGFFDGENDGPITNEKLTEKIDADFVWSFDMMEELGVFPHNLATSSPLVVGDLIYLITSNGVDEGHLNIPSPQAPSFIAVNKKTGKLVWEDGSPGERIYHGQWASPGYGVVNGKPQVYFPGGDGWLYAFELSADAENPGKGKMIWKFNCNPPWAKYILGGKGTANEIIATPVFQNGRVYIAVGQDPEHLEGEGHLWAIDATKVGDTSPFLGEWNDNDRWWAPQGIQKPADLNVPPWDGKSQIWQGVPKNPNSGALWHYGYRDFGRTIATVAVADDLVYAVELSGILHCLDRKTGTLYWKHDLLAAAWGSPFVVDGKVYIGDEDGDIAILAHNKNKKLLNKDPKAKQDREDPAMNLADAVYSTPVIVDGVMYVMTRTHLYAIQNR